MTTQVICYILRSYVVVYDDMMTDHDDTTCYDILQYVAQKKKHVPHSGINRPKIIVKEEVR